MARDDDRVEGRRVLALSVSYLVFHCFVTAVALALLTVASLAYAGALDVPEPLGLTLVVAGVELPVRALLVALWVVGAALAVAGLAFGILSVLARRRPALLGPAMWLGRAMFALSLLDLVLSFLQASPVTALSSVVSAVLTGALALELRHLEEAFVSSGRDVSTPRRSFFVEAAEGPVEPKVALGDEGKALLRLCGGYTTVMLAWGTLRVLMGLSTLLVAPASAPGPWRFPALVFGLAISVAGGYLLFVGALGKRALAQRASTGAFATSTGVGLAASFVTLVTFVVWLVLGWTPDGLLVFSSAVDCLLYAAGLHYVVRFGRELGKKS